MVATTVAVGLLGVWAMMILATPFVIYYNRKSGMSREESTSDGAMLLLGPFLGGACLCGIAVLAALVGVAWVCQLLWESLMEAAEAHHPQEVSEEPEMTIVD